MICITGSPGSGKSTVASILRSRGFAVRNVLDFPGSMECVSNGEASIECLRAVTGRLSLPGEFVEGHYSHLMDCDSVIILDRDEDRVLAELSSRGYSRDKIMENLDALRCDIYFSESLESLPRSRIKRISVVEGDPEFTATLVQRAASDLEQELRRHVS
ncbi:MAG: AAA family ATPase [Thermoplasmataceae archaeon]